jgi:hypothetical protein
MYDSSRIDNDMFHKNSISMIVKKVKTLDLKKISDLGLISNLSEYIYAEWLSMRSKYRNKLRHSKMINEYLHAEYEAEEELVVSLLTLLNQKIIHFIIPMSEKNIIK